MYLPLTPLFLFSPARSGRHVATLGEGDDFGETALVGEGKRHASVVTAEPTTVLWMTKEAYEGRMKALREAEVALLVEERERAAAVPQPADAAPKERDAARVEIDRRR